MGDWRVSTLDMFYFVGGVEMVLFRSDLALMALVRNPLPAGRGRPAWFALGHMLPTVAWAGGGVSGGVPPWKWSPSASGHPGFFFEWGGVGISRASPASEVVFGIRFYF